MTPPNTGPTVLRIDLSLIATIGIVGRDGRINCTQLDQQDKALAIKVQQN
jgi:hypothetical protein